MTLFYTKGTYAPLAVGVAIIIYANHQQRFIDRYKITLEKGMNAMFNKDFYPTPETLAHKMLDK
ncbi:hypothetical protein, partial [Cysteiniphilum sp. 5D8B4]|uniref:hypothetical protein n=1 Tax=unclassified Cysteiniphilum TaxID=2610889 RepID=UPI003F852C59